MTTNLWLIEARDPFIARDGRPFDNTPGARAASLAFPFPSTTTGGVRTRAGFGSLGGGGHFDRKLAAAVRDIAVRGPLLVELGDGGEVVDWLAPAPADARLLGKGDSGRLVPLVPLTLGPGFQTNLPSGLAPVGMRGHDPSKPHPYPPRFWHWHKFEEWLAGPTADASQIEPKLLGHDGPTHELRTHVRIDYENKSHDPGGLFQTRGLEFARAARDGSGTPRRLALAVEADAPDQFEGTLRQGLAPLGGERRVVSWRQGAGSFPKCPPVVRERIIEDKHCRLVLLTPAHFDGGFMPKWLQEERGGVRAKVCAMAVGRPQVISGWDFENRRPKPTRRLAPAGTVIFIELEGHGQIEEWVDTTWMRCVSDSDQDRLDGFGLAALGTWDGSYEEMS